MFRCASGSVGILRDTKDISCICRHICIHALRAYPSDEANRQAATAERRQYYLGLPITSSALAIPAVYLIGEFTAIHIETIAALALLVIGICYVLPVKLKKPSLFGEVLLVGIGAVEFCILIAEVLI